MTAGIITPPYGVFVNVEEEVTVLKARVGDLEFKIAENTAITQSVKDDTKEMIGYFKDGKVLFKFAKGAAVVIKWLIIIGAIVAWFGSVFYAVTHGLPIPPIPSIKS